VTLTKTEPYYLSGYFNGRQKCRFTYIGQKYGQEVVDYLAHYADMADPGTEVMATAEDFNIEVMNFEVLKAFINLKRINDISDPNLFFCRVNAKLPVGGAFIVCAETIASRKRRLLNKYPIFIAYPYYFFDFILKRVFPKMRFTAKINRLLTRGENRVISQTEALGRLTACGFEIKDYREIGFLTYFICRKSGAPLATKSVNYGFIIKLKRVGKGGRLFNVYKFRTMHPYAEYLQEYLCAKNGLIKGDKIIDDFRVTSWGRIMRKLWIDEQPMWINLLKGDVKLVGVRPLSEQKLSVYPDNLRTRRLNYKPGLIPPFYVDMPENEEEFFCCENKYLDAYDCHPLLTDFRYFWIALYNILIKRARSA
jgi:hypothetical protein